MFAIFGFPCYNQACKFQEQFKNCIVYFSKIYISEKGLSSNSGFMQKNCISNNVYFKKNVINNQGECGSNKVCKSYLLNLLHIWWLICTTRRHYWLQFCSLLYCIITQYNTCKKWSSPAGCPAFCQSLHLHCNQQICQRLVRSDQTLVRM